MSRLLDSGVDIAIVAKMAGHSNIQTTARYDRRPEDAKRRAANLLKIPYAESVETIRLIKESALSTYPQGKHWIRTVFQEGMVARGSTKTFADLFIRLPTPQELAILKAIAHRPKDLDDIRTIADEYPNLD